MTFAGCLKTNIKQFIKFQHTTPHPTSFSNTKPNPTLFLPKNKEKFESTSSKTANSKNRKHN